MSKYKEIGKEIKARRLALGWSQIQLAVNAGVSASTVHRIETGRTNPRPAVLQVIYKALTGRW